jgi:putative transposase
MSRKYKFWDSDKIYFISFATVNWVDVFIRNEYKDEVIKCWEFCQTQKGLEIYAWCIMPSHVHMTIGSNGKPLEDIVRDMKSYTSSQMKKLIAQHPQESRKEWLLWMFERAGKKNSNNNDWQFWQQHNQPIQIKTDQQYYDTLHYIHQNPVVSGFVTEPSHWKYNSANGYEKNDGLVKLTI